jgi:hypothetical protein
MGFRVNKICFVSSGIFSVYRALCKSVEEKALRNVITLSFAVPEKGKISISQIEFQ